jgi:hypothetical protein
MTTIKILALSLALAGAASANLIPTPFGTIDGIALTGSGMGQFAQSSPQQGEIQFNFTLDNGEIITGEVCSFGDVTCVAGGTGATYTPELYVSFTVGCGMGNCAAVSYDLSASYSFTGSAIGTSATSGSFASNDIEGMNGGDAVSFEGEAGGSLIGGVTVDPTSGVSSFPFSGSFGPSAPVVNSGGSVTANINGSFTIAGPEDTLIYSGDVSLQSATAPEPATFGLLLASAVIGIGWAKRRGRYQVTNP